jgi:gamma-glutamylcyclotransferase (GGCT)/AIG2-like uncharacterized protein YtfP
MPKAQLFFVYGTLRRGDDNDITRLHPAPTFLGQAHIHGTMYHFGAYPGVILASEEAIQSQTAGKIVGEVYEVSAQLERVLDQIEAQYPMAADYYFKRSITIEFTPGSPLQAYVYEVNPKYVVGRAVIASGDWVRDR